MPQSLQVEERQQESATIFKGKPFGAMTHP